MLGYTFCTEVESLYYSIPRYNENLLISIGVMGTRLFGLADSVWPFRSEPFRSQDISLATFLYIRNWWSLLTLFT